MEIVDLHSHSSHSDGYFSLKSLFEMANQSDVQLFSVTDHDTISSQKEAKKLAKKYNISYLSGVEISCDFFGQVIHIVGLGIDCNNLELNQALNSLHSMRKKRALKIAKLIEKETDLENVFNNLNRNQNHSYGRLHFADFLVDHQLAKNSYIAFNKYLAQGAPCYVSIQWISILQAIKLIHLAGGRAVLAHPLKYKMSSSKLKHLFSSFKERAGDGVEVINGRDRKKNGIQKIAGLAHFYSLALSCGSDFHHRFSQKIGVETHLLPNVPKQRIWHDINIQ